MIEYVLAYCQDDDRILVVHKDRPAWQKGRINLPGGKMEPGDLGNCGTAAARELWEETGYRADYATISGTIGFEGGRVWVVRMVNVERIGDPRDGETEKCEWVSWYKLLHSGDLIPNLRIAIPLLMAGVWGWHIEDNESSAGKSHHTMNVMVPTHHQAGE